MLTGQRRKSLGLVRTAVIAVIGVTFLTLAVAGTRAAGTSFMDAVKGFFGLQSEAAINVIDRDWTGGRATASTTFVISQAYGGGGGTTGTYLKDYVELKNISSSPQSLAGLSLMYGSATGQFASLATNAYALTGGTVQPGQYYLVELSPAGTGGVALPVTADESTTNLNMSGTNGKVALVTSAFVANTCGGSATPCTLPNPDIIDLVAWGTANNAEGGAATNGGASITSVQGNVRKNNGCQDTDNNNSDFDIVTAPVPRNSTTTIACGGPTPTATNTATASPTPTHTATPTSTATLAATPTASPSPVAGSTFVISHAYGGGGGATGTYLNDYVELKNISSSPQSLAGLSLMYGSATGNFASTAANAYALTGGTVQPGQYYLIQLGPAGTAGAPLPVTPDETTGNLTMSGTNGKVALVTAALAPNTCGATATPCTLPNAAIVDLVAWGTANNAEGGAPTNGGASLTSVQGNVRKQNGCQDTDNNNSDFDIVTAPVPRNSATAAAPCAGGPSPTATNTFTPTSTATNTPTATPTAPPSGRTAFDYDGDHKTDISVFRPTDGAWYLQQSQAGLFGMLFGFGSDKIAPADYDGDGKTDIAVYRPSTGIWYVLKSTDGTVEYFVFGLAEDLPTPADYDGDGKADVSVYRPSSGTWYRQNSSDGSYTGIQFGATEDKPTIGDWDGDGKSDIAVFRPSTGAWYRINSGNGSIYGELFGFGTDVITPADFDGDHKMDLAAYRPSTGIWYVKFSANSTYDYKVFGLANDIPAVGDFDGDGKADVSVFRPSDGTWYRQNSSNDAYIAFQFGANGDKPTMTAFRY